METRGAVDAVAIEQRDGGIAELGGAIDERFGKRRALEKTERRRGVELDVRRRHDSTSIDNGVNEPGVGVAILEDAIDRAIAERDVPFVSIKCAGHSIFYFAWGPTFIYRGGDPTPAAVARRMRASQRLKAVTRVTRSRRKPLARIQN